ncbi:baseplate J/gp47 family protein [Paenibacillus sp. P25]|nr:baseplate J/gp47 family protein [Paenibacillus sp. P25]
MDETGHLSGEELSGLEREEGRTEILRDSEGHVMKCWIRYEPVTNLLNSGAADRHYRIDRLTGRLYFGDGVHGKRLPNSDLERVRVSYTTGGGARGNVDKLVINQLQTSIAFIQSVSNPEPASGGCDPEPLEEALKRGPQLIKHRGRAVTAEDFEWLAREAYPDIGHVKCLPGRNVRMEKEAGCITLVVLPKTGGYDHAAFSEIKQHLEAYLRERAAFPLAFPGKIQVIPRRISKSACRRCWL